MLAGRRAEVLELLQNNTVEELEGNVERLRKWVVQQEEGAAAAAGAAAAPAGAAAT